MAESAVFYAVDRIEGAMAILVSDDGTTIDIPRSRLPRRIREGTVLRIRMASDGTPDWATAEPDEEERQRRLKLARERLDRLGGRDPGGDITI